MADDEIGETSDPGEGTSDAEAPPVEPATPPSGLTPQQQRLAIIGGAIAAVVLLVTVIVAGGSDDGQSLTPGSSTTTEAGATTTEATDATSTTIVDTTSTEVTDTSAPATGGEQPQPVPGNPATDGTATPLLRLPGSGAAFNRDGSAILVSPPPTGGSVKLVNSTTGATMREFGDDPSAQFSPDFSKVVTTPMYREHVMVWPVGGGPGITIPRPNLTFRFSQDGTKLFGWDQSMIGTWDANTGEQLSMRDLPVFFGLDLSPDGTQVLTAAARQCNCDVHLWTLATGEKLRTFTGAGGAAAFSPDGVHVLISRGWGDPTLWNAATGEQVQTYTGIVNLGVAWFSPDGSHVAVANFDDGTAEVLDTISGISRASFSGLDPFHPQPFAVFSPDGSRFVTYAADGTLTGWDSDTGTVVARFEPPPGLVSGNGVANYSVVVSADGHKLAATFPGAVTVVWNADTGEQILQVADLTEPRFSPDGTRLAGVSGDGNFISVYAV